MIWTRCSIHPPYEQKSDERDVTSLVTHHETKTVESFSLVCQIFVCRPGCYWVRQLRHRRLRPDAPSRTSRRYSGKVPRHWMTVHGSSAISGHQNSPQDRRSLTPRLHQVSPRPTGCRSRFPRSHPGSARGQKERRFRLRVAPASRPTGDKAASRPGATGPGRSQAGGRAKGRIRPPGARLRKFGIAGSSVGRSMTVLHHSPPTATATSARSSGSGGAVCAPRRPRASGFARTRASSRSRSRTVSRNVAIVPSALTSWRRTEPRSPPRAETSNWRPGDLAPPPIDLATPPPRPTTHGVQAPRRCAGARSASPRCAHGGDEEIPGVPALGEMELPPGQGARSGCRGQRDHDTGPQRPVRPNSELRDSRVPTTSTAVEIRCRLGAASLCAGAPAPSAVPGGPPEQLAADGHHLMGSRRGPPGRSCASLGLQLTRWRCQS